MSQASNTARTRPFFVVVALAIVATGGCHGAAVGSARSDAEVVDCGQGTTIWQEPNSAGCAGQEAHDTNVHPTTIGRGNDGTCQACFDTSDTYLFHRQTLDSAKSGAFEFSAEVASEPDADSAFWESTIYLDDAVGDPVPGHGNTNGDATSIFTQGCSMASTSQLVNFVDVRVSGNPGACIVFKNWKIVRLGS